MSAFTLTAPARAAAPASVSIDHVSKQFETNGEVLRILNDVSLDVRPGEIVALLGPSGCGKSTLLRLVGGLDQPTSGSVRIDGDTVTGIDPRSSIVFQEPRLLPWKSLASNVRLGTRGRDDVAAIDELLDLVGLAGFADYLPKQVSGGMAQRTALARALVGRPGVLLLDEPFAALDALTRMRMQDLLVEVTSEFGTTVLLVTHDVDEALYLADRIVVLGQRGEGIAETVDVSFGHPRDRSDARLAPLRTQLLRRFGIHV